MTLLFTGLMLAGSAPAPAAFPPLVRTPVLEQPVPAANPPVRLVRGAVIRFAPRQPTGLHLHPVSTVGIVTEGRFVFQPDGAPRHILNRGDVFFEPAGRRILHFDNALPSRPAAIEVFYLTDTKDRTLITMLRR